MLMCEMYRMHVDITTTLRLPCMHTSTPTAIAAQDSFLHEGETITHMYHHCRVPVSLVQGS